jgi:hypothetical protein
MPRPDYAEGTSQYCYMANKKRHPAIGEVDREEVGPAWHKISPVVSHF